MDGTNSINLYLIRFRNGAKAAIAATSIEQAREYAGFMPCAYDGLLSTVRIHPAELPGFGIESGSVWNASQIHPNAMPENFRRLWRGDRSQLSELLQTLDESLLEEVVRDD